MPRWPAGLHAASGSGTAYGYRARRPPVTPQRHYWRHTATALHEGGQSVLVPVGLRLFPVVQISQLPAYATAGPQAAGEQWLVDQVQVNIGGQYGQPPLVIQQFASQASASVTTPPPPIIAQVWRNHAGIPWNTGKLLAQTSQGGNDAMSVASGMLTAGEVITVVWYGWAPNPGGLPWMTLNGTRFALSVT